MAQNPARNHQIEALEDSWSSTMPDLQKIAVSAAKISSSGAVVGIMAFLFRSPESAYTLAGEMRALAAYIAVSVTLVWLIYIISARIQANRKIDRRSRIILAREDASGLQNRE